MINHKIMSDKEVLISLMGEIDKNILVFQDIIFRYEKMEKYWVSRIFGIKYTKVKKECQDLIDESIDTKELVQIEIDKFG